MTRPIHGETAGVFQAVRDQKLCERMYLEQGAITRDGERVLEERGWLKVEVSSVALPNQR